MPTFSRLRFGDEGRGRVLAGAKMLADALRSTLGPRARSVLIGRRWGNPIVCDDGVTIAKAVRLEDAEEDLGAQLLRQAAVRTGELVGDGTTTSTLLAYALVADGVRNIVAGVCWGNYEGPHDHDVALRELLPILLRARPMALSFAAANPRHAHEWACWEALRLPADELLMPGVIDSTTNYVEHPELVAERILRLTRLVGRERVIASTDCGFGTFAGIATVAPSVAWAKLEALVAGARWADAHG